MHLTGRYEKKSRIHTEIESVQNKKNIQEYLRCGKSRVCTLTFYRIGKVPAMRPPPLTEPERNAVQSVPTVTNGGTAQQVHRRSVIVAFLSEPVKGKPPYGGGWFCLRFRI